MIKNVKNERPDLLFERLVNTPRLADTNYNTAARCKVCHKTFLIWEGKLNKSC